MYFPDGLQGSVFLSGLSMSIVKVQNLHFRINKRGLLVLHWATQCSSQCSSQLPLFNSDKLCDRFIVYYIATIGIRAACFRPVGLFGEPARKTARENLGEGYEGEGERTRSLLSLSRNPSPSSFYPLAVLPANPVFRVTPQLIGTGHRRNRNAQIGGLRKPQRQRQRERR